MGRNAVALSGELTAVEPLRHTPAGIALLNFRLAHRSQQMEAGFRRQVDCEVNAVAVGELAVAISRMPHGRTVDVEGFLNRKNRMSTQLILHVTKAQISEETEYAETGTQQGQG